MPKTSLHIGRVSMHSKFLLELLWDLSVLSGHSDRISNPDLLFPPRTKNLTSSESFPIEDRISFLRTELSLGPTSSRRGIPRTVRSTSFTSATLIVSSLIFLFWNTWSPMKATWHCPSLLSLEQLVTVHERPRISTATNLWMLIAALIAVIDPCWYSCFLKLYKRGKISIACIHESRCYLGYCSDHWAQCYSVDD